ncbi:histidine kinase [Hymenobacter sp.]|jgi:sensor histidine kinase YesM|uniref:sensor histidine kinase n=1 Tax=Hymenobacter sp. TaxID=1898978 RepID=UPI002ED850C6
MSEPTFSPGLRWQTLSARRTAVLLQLLLWVLLCGFYFAWNSRPNYHFKTPVWPLVLLEMSFSVLLFNSLVYFLIPRVLLRGRYVLALVSGLLLVVLYQLWSYAGTLLMALYLPPSSDLLYNMQYFNAWDDVVHNLSTVQGFVNIIFSVLSTMMFPVLVSFLTYALIVDRRRLLLERANFNLELSYLKAQLNPQFLFTTLRSLQDLTRTHDARAGDVVLHLADLLRYTLYETDAERVPLTRELEFLDDYLTLERIRYPTVSIDHQVTGTATTQQLAPLLLHPFYEQLFMGLSAETGSVIIKSTIQVEAQVLTLSLHRDLAPGATLPSYQPVALAAAERRLQLQYPGQHTVQIQENGSTLHVSLHLQL